MDEYQQQIWKLYQTLPDDLKEAFFSPEVTENVSSICKTFEIDEFESRIMKTVSDVIIGIISLDSFEEELTKNVPEVDENTIKRVGQQISRTIFLPLRDSLSSLFGSGVVKAKIKEVLPEKKTNKSDPYREQF